MPSRRAASARVPASAIAWRRSTLPGPRAIWSPWKTRRRGRTAVLGEDLIQLRDRIGFAIPGTTRRGRRPVPPERSEMWMPLLLFVVFTLLSVAGAYLVAAHWRGRRAGIVAALLTALFFAAVLFGVLALM